MDIKIRLHCCVVLFHVYNYILNYDLHEFQVLVSPSYTPNQVADVMDCIMHNQVHNIELLVTKCFEMYCVLLNSLN